MGLTHIERNRISFGLATPEIGDNALLVASNEVGTLPASNLRLPIPFDRWRTETGEVTPNLVYDIGVNPLPISLVWLGYTNATAAATIRVRAADTEANLTAAPAFDSGVTAHRRQAWVDWDRTHGYVQLAQPIAYRWWRIDIDNTGANYYEAGRAYLCDPWVPPRGIDFQSRIQAQALAKKDRSLGGVGFARDRGKFRRASFTIKAVSEIELFELSGSIERRRGDSRDVLVMLDRNTPDRHMSKTLYSYFRALPEMQLRTREIWRKAYDFEEVEHP